MKVQQKIKKHRLTKIESVRIQILMWCTLRHIQVTSSILDMLTVLAMSGRMEFASFCSLLTNAEICSNYKSNKDKKSGFIFKTTQSARNMVKKAIVQGLIIRIGKKHEIELNPTIEVVKEDNLLVNYQLLTIDPN